MKTCCGYSLEAPQWGASNEYHHICFHVELRKISLIFFVEKKKTLSGAMKILLICNSALFHLPFLHAIINLGLLLILGTQQSLQRQHTTLLTLSNYQNIPKVDHSSYP